MIEYGIKTWKSISFPALIFLSLASFLFFNAIQTKINLNNEVKENGRVYVILEDGQEKITLPNSVNVGDCSYVYDIDTIIQTQSVDVDIHITGINTNMIEGDLVVGDYYSDDSSETSVLINMCALSKLSGNDSISADKSGEWVGRTVIVGKDLAKISGVIEDNSNTSCMYMSVLATKNFIKKHQDIQNVVSYGMKVPNMRIMLHIQKILSDSGFSISVDAERIFEWKVESVLIKDRIIMGIIVVLTSICMMLLSIRVTKQSEKPQKKGVYFIRIGVNVFIGIIIGFICNCFVFLWNNNF